MKYFFTILSILFLPIFCLKEIKPKFCINCKYFIEYHIDDKYSKCSFFKKEEDKPSIFTLVNGISQKKDIEYHYCCISRQIEEMCGKEGKMYKKKYIKKAEKRCEKAVMINGMKAPKKHHSSGGLYLKYFTLKRRNK